MFSRFERQADLVPGDTLARLKATVIGVGAIGRQVALQLAALGIRRLQLVDFDQVEETNLTTQGYFRADLQRAKVDATADLIGQLDPTIVVDRIPQRYRPQPEPDDVLFCCVDAITTRAAIWRSVGKQARFWSDGRMLGEVLRVLTVADDASRHHYPTTLFAAADAQPGRCTARSTIYTANVAAGCMVHQFTRWLRGLPVDADLTLNLLASELTVASPVTA